MNKRQQECAEKFQVFKVAPDSYDMGTVRICDIYTVSETTAKRWRQLMGWPSSKELTLAALRRKQELLRKDPDYGLEAGFASQTIKALSDTHDVGETTVSRMMKEDGILSVGLNSEFKDKRHERNVWKQARRSPISEFMYAWRK